MFQEEKRQPVGGRKGKKKAMKEGTSRAHKGEKNDFSTISSSRKACERRSTKRVGIIVETKPKKKSGSHLNQRGDRLTCRI